MHIAQSVLAVANQTSPITKKIMDRTSHIGYTFVDQVINRTQFSWHGRRPFPAYDPKGQKRAHDLDLLSVMMELMKDGADIRLPGYENMLAWQITAGEQHVGTDRFGQILGLVSHREHLSFSVRIRDRSVIRHSDAKTGALRTYAMVGYNGEWNPGWRGVEWKFSDDEAEFYERQRLLHNGEIDFQYYVHPERRQSSMSAAYLDSKALWQRLEDEAAHYSTELKRLEAAGIEMPADLKQPVQTILATGRTQNVYVRRFMMKLEGLEYTGEFPTVRVDAAGYRVAYERRRVIIEQLQPMVQFVMRAAEAAFYLYGMKQGFTPWWIKGSSWVPKTRLAQHAKSATLHLTDRVSLSYYTDEVPKAVAAKVVDAA